MSSPALSIACRSGSPSRASIAFPSTVTWTIFGVLINFASAAMELQTVPFLVGPLVLNAILQLHKPVENGFGPRRTTGDIKMDGDDAVDTLQYGVIIIGPAGTGAGAKGHYPFRFRHLFIDAA